MWIVPHLPEQGHETRGWHHADLPRQSLGNCRPPLFLTAAIRVRLRTHTRHLFIFCHVTGKHECSFDSKKCIHLYCDHLLLLNSSDFNVHMRLWGTQNMNTSSYRCHNPPLLGQSRNGRAGSPGECSAQAESVSA